VRGFEVAEEQACRVPPSSAFVFTYEFSARDRDESVEISSFLAEHGYKVKNVQNWTFLASNPAR